MSGFLEVCVESVEGLQHCAKANVDRVELCSSLPLGGLTPSSGMIAEAVRLNLTTFVLIRPRAGNFCYNKAEQQVMLHDIKTAKHSGASGAVLGASTKQNTLDIPLLQTLCEAAKGIQTTLHRVIDTLDNPYLALEQAIALGFDYVLTSGGATRVYEGMSVLTRLNQQAAGRIQIIAGAGLQPQDIGKIAAATGITHFHASCSQSNPTEQRLVELGFSAASSPMTSIDRIQEYLQMVDRLDG